MALPITPPSASISRTRCPFAVPPTAGLHGMCATVSGPSVQIATLQPRRAAAWAASTPAWPAPMTITSNFGKRTPRDSTCEPATSGNSKSRHRSFSDTEPLEDMRQQIVGRVTSDDFCERLLRRLQVRQHELLWRLIERRHTGVVQMRSGSIEERDMPRIGYRRSVAQRFAAGQTLHDRSTQIFESS